MKKINYYNDYLSDCKNSKVMPIAIEDEKVFASETDEKLHYVFLLFDKANKQIADINEKINTLAHYVGMPYKLTDIRLSYSPALIDGSQRSCPGYIGYTVDLTPYRDDFAYVRFQACAPLDNKELVRAYIVDDFGNIESYIEEDSTFCSDWTRMSITQYSRKLVATLPLNKNGAPLFIPTYVELLSNGLSQGMCEVKENLMNLANLVGYDGKCKPEKGTDKVVH